MLDLFLIFDNLFIHILVNIVRISLLININYALYHSIKFYFPGELNFHQRFLKTYVF